MVKEVTKLKLPINPGDLLNLYDLRDQLRLKEELEKNTDKYIWDYFKSFLKTSDEVLKYIPEEMYGKYSLNSNYPEIYNLDLPDALYHCDRDFKFIESLTPVLYLVDIKNKCIEIFGPLLERFRNDKFSGETTLISHNIGWDQALQVTIEREAKTWVPIFGSQYVQRPTTQFVSRFEYSFNINTNTFEGLTFKFNFNTRDQTRGFERFSQERIFWKRLRENRDI